MKKVKLKIKLNDKVKLNIKLNAPEEFKCGDCEHCPLKQKSQENISCKIGYQPMTCPIEEMEG